MVSGWTGVGAGGGTGGTRSVGVGTGGGAGGAGGEVGGVVVDGAEDISVFDAEGGDSVMKAPTALQALQVSPLIALTFQ